MFELEIEQWKNRCKVNRRVQQTYFIKILTNKMFENY